LSSLDLQKRETTPLEEPAVSHGHNVSQRDGLSDLVKIAAVVFVFGWYMFHPARFASILDPDIWWHMRTGEWIMQNGHLPRVDPFSITGAGKRWVAYSWSFEIAIYWTARIWDLLGLVSYTVFGYLALTAVFFHLVFAIARRFWISLALTFVASLTFPLILMPRPGVLTTLLFMVLLDVLLHAHRSGGRGILIAAPLLIWLWSNVHVQFVYGLILIGAFAIAHSVSAQQARRFWAALAVSVAVSFANPYGWGLYRVIIDFVRQPKLYTLVQETQPMAFNRMEPFVAMGLCIGAVAVITRLRHDRVLWSLLLLWAVTSALRAQRDIWLAVVIASAVIATYFGSLGTKMTVNVRVWLASCACVLLLAVVSFRNAPTNKLLMARLTRQFPVGAVAYINEHHLRGPIFNNFDWGGFLIYALPKMPVAIDGRTNVHGQDEIERSFHTWDAQTSWQDDPLLRQANLVIGSPSFRLTNALRTDPHFKLLFDDGTAVLFQRVQEDSR
jgi:hypothetical protein